MIKPKLRCISLLTLAASIAVLCPLAPAHGQNAGTSVTERASAAANNAKTSIQDASSDALSKIDQIWQRIDERRLKNRTGDEIVAWVIMGILVGACAGLLTIVRTSAVQRFMALGIGLFGAFVGGIIAHVAQLDFGMGPVLIRYEDLLLSLIGGLLLLGTAKFLAARRRGKV